MNFNLQIINDWRIWIAVISGASFLFSVFNLIVGRHVANKITKNDLTHLKTEVKEIKQEHKEIKIDLKKDLEKIFRRLGKIDKGLAVRDAICELRHKNDKK